MSGVTFVIPIATVNPLNRREHWTVRAERVRTEREAARWTWLACGVRSFPAPPYVVTFTRIAPRFFDDDAVPPSLKGIRDELATLLGITDGPKDKRAKWVYADQEKGTPGVRVTIEAKP